MVICLYKDINWRMSPVFRPVPRQKSCPISHTPDDGIGKCIWTIEEQPGIPAFSAQQMTKNAEQRFSRNGRIAALRTFCDFKNEENCCRVIENLLWDSPFSRGHHNSHEGASGNMQPNRYPATNCSTSTHHAVAVAANLPLPSVTHVSPVRLSHGVTTLPDTCPRNEIQPHTSYSGGLADSDVPHTLFPDVLRTQMTLFTQNLLFSGFYGLR